MIVDPKRLQLLTNVAVECHDTLTKVPHEHVKFSNEIFTDWGVGCRDCDVGVARSRYLSAAPRMLREHASCARSGSSPGQAINSRCTRTTAQSKFCIIDGFSGRARC